MTRTASPQPKAGLVVQPIDDEAVVYDPEADKLHHLEPTATAVWTRLARGRPLSSVAGAVAAAYGADPDAVHADILTLTGTFYDRGLLDGSATTRSASGAYTEPPLGLGFDNAQPLPPASLLTRPFRGLEHSFAVTTNDPSVRAYLDEVLTDLAYPPRADATRYEFLVVDQDHYVVRQNGQVVLATGRLDRAVTALLWHINAEAIRRTTLIQPVVHAAAAVKDGATILLPAPPNGGKTTTVAGLVASGFTYLTDEAVAIDPTTLLPSPYPKPMSIGRGSWEVLSALHPSRSLITEPWLVPATSIRPDAIAGPAPIRVVIEPAYDPAAATRLESVSPAAMLVRLADSTFNFPDEPERNLKVLAEVVMRADCYRLAISDLDEAVKLVTNAIAPGRRRR